MSDARFGAALMGAGLSGFGAFCLDQSAFQIAGVMVVAAVIAYQSLPRPVLLLAGVASFSFWWFMGHHPHASYILLLLGLSCTGSFVAGFFFRGNVEVAY